MAKQDSESSAQQERRKKLVRIGVFVVLIWFIAVFALLILLLTPGFLLVFLVP
ncbi:hypothetical protein [Persicimonas caeni]|uniref:hypothetical protein n=1 Tax=Persicimonas caeni TaxID=2292766 RepID=UPI00164DF13A|nr:hypothetical protein [Persicimonas caeni]